MVRTTDSPLTGSGGALGRNSSKTCCGDCCLGTLEERSTHRLPSDAVPVSCGSHLLCCDRAASVVDTHPRIQPAAKNTLYQIARQRFVHSADVWEACVSWFGKLVGAEGFAVEKGLWWWPYWCARVLFLFCWVNLGW